MLSDIYRETLLETLHGFLRETRIITLYAIPAAILILFLKRMEWDATFLILFIQIAMFVNIVSREDSDTLDSVVATFLSFLATTLGWYIIIRTSMYYLFTEYKFGQDPKVDGSIGHLSILLLYEYLDFMLLLTKFRSILLGVVGFIYVAALVISRFIPI